MENIKEEIYKKALEEHEEFKKIPESEIKQVIETTLREIEEFENISNPELNSKLKALWVFSGAGTYHGVVMGERYSKYEWAKSMDRERLDYAIQLARVSKKVYGNAPMIIYNGGDDQNVVLQEMLRNKDTDLLPEEITILGSGIKNTLDQIETFVLPENLYESEGEIGLISHAPQLMRILHMLNKYQTTPKDMKIRLFPIKTSIEAKETYTTMEIKGLLYYLFIGENASVSAYPYLV